VSAGGVHGDKLRWVIRFVDPVNSLSSTRSGLFGGGE
jgi:hypothetical protein